MNALGYLTIVAMLITALILVVGLAGFYRGGDFNRRYGNLLMRARVLSQGVTIVLLVLFLWSLT